MDDEGRSKPPSSEELLRLARVGLARGIDPAPDEAPRSAAAAAMGPDPADGRAEQSGAIAGDRVVEEAQQQALPATRRAGRPSKIRCTHCTDDVPVGAARCPNCGNDPRVRLRDRPAPPPPPRAPTQNGRRGRAGLIGAVAVAVAVSSAIFLFNGGGDSEPASEVFLAVVDESLFEAGVGDEARGCVGGVLTSGGRLEQLDLLAESDIDTALLDSLQQFNQGVIGTADLPVPLGDALEGYAVALQQCLSESEIASALSVGAADNAPQTFGDSDPLDQLWRDCEEEDFVGCDILNLASPVGTDYEVFGRTCGQRGLPAEGSCVVQYLGFPDLETLSAGCGVGDYGSCDILYFFTPVGSEEERYGATCGDRRAFDETLRCVYEFGVGSARGP